MTDFEEACSRVIPKSAGRGFPNYVVPQESEEDSEIELCAGYDAAPTLHIGESQPETKGVLVCALNASDIAAYNAFFFPEDDKNDTASIGYYDTKRLTSEDTQEPRKAVIKWAQPSIWASNDGPPPSFFRPKTAGHRYRFFHGSFRHPMG